MYRPSANPPTTAWARHLDNVMRERDWSRVRLFEEVGAELGYRPKSRTAILKLLTRTEPDARQAAILAAHFGWPPEPTPAPPEATESADTLVAALTRQSAALEALVAEMREEREGRLRALELAVERLVTRAIEGASDPPAPLAEVR